jgi:hypothetical protein
VAAAAVAAAGTSARVEVTTMTRHGGRQRDGARPVPTETAVPRPGAGGPRRRPRALPTVLAALACFAVVFEFLAFQLNAGRDPALGKSAGSPAATKKLRPKRKIIITKVIGAPRGSSTATGSATASTTAASAPAPVTTATS